jgi:2-iminobutanoate/2-iminopropanoate deaminase
MKFKTFVVCAALFASTAAVAADQPLSALPFSETVTAGDTLYIAGHLGLDPKTGQAVQGAEAEAKAVMDSFMNAVKSGGMTADELVSVTVYCTDIGLFDTFNKVYKTYFHGKYPTRAFIGVAALVRGGHFEVQGIAAKSKAH